MKQLLLVKMSSLGDVVHALPAVDDAIAAGWQVDWVVEEAFADIPRAHNGVRTVLPIAWRRWRKNFQANAPEMAIFFRQLKAQKYDCVLDSQGLIKSALVAVQARGPRAGFSHTSAREPWAAFSYRQRIQVAKGQHAIDRQRQLFAAALGYELPQVSAPGLYAQAGAGSSVLLLHGTTWQSKHWPESMWQALVKDIAASGFTPTVTWGNEEERARAERLATAGAQVLERKPLGELIQIIVQQAAVIAVDSGLGHLAAALGVPTMGLYGATSGELTGCRGARARFLQGEAPCVPCLAKTCRYRGPEQTWADQTITPACFASVTPERVWQATQALMAEGDR